LQQVTSFASIHGWFVGLKKESFSKFPTVYRYRNQYISGGVSGYLGNKYKGYWCLLSSCQLSLLRKEMKEHILGNFEKLFT
jgi:hypothetical protein